MITSRRKLAQVLDNRITPTRMTDQFNEPNVDHGHAMPGPLKIPWSGAAAMKRLANQFDLLISSVPHIVIQEALDGKAVDWMEKASDQQIAQVTKEIYGTNIRVNCPPRRVQTE